MLGNKGIIQDLVKATIGGWSDMTTFFFHFKQDIMF